jgi:hypothetical protein
MKHSARSSHAARGVLMLWVALLTGGWAGGLCAATADSAKVERLMEASGISHSLKQMLPGVLSGFDEAQQQKVMPVQVRAALRDAATQAFQTAPMLEKVRARLSGLSAAQIDDALNWLGTPLGRRLTALENAVSEPDAPEKIAAYAQTLQKKPAPAARLKLIQELDRASGASEMLGNTMEAIMLATALGMNAAQPRQQQMPPEALRKQIKAGMPDVQKQTEQYATVALLYTYGTVTDSDLETYLKFMRSPSGAAFTKLGTAGYSDALFDGIARFMTAIPKALERSKGAVGT